jgi:hypothetical protein
MSSAGLRTKNDCAGEDQQQFTRPTDRLRLALSDGLNKVDVSHHLTWGRKTDPVSETLYSLEYRKMDKVQKLSSLEWIIHRRQNPFKYKNRRILGRTIICIKFYGTHELLVRGHDETKSFYYLEIFLDLMSLAVLSYYIRRFTGELPLVDGAQIQ